jgi:hypothetical protein
MENTEQLLTLRGKRGNGKADSRAWRMAHLLLSVGVADHVVMVLLPHASLCGRCWSFIAAPVTVLLFFASVARVEWQWSADLAE